MTKSNALPAIKLNLRPSHLRAVGHVVTQWAFLETEIDFTIRALQAIVNDPGVEMGLPKNFTRRLRLWKDLTKMAIPSTDIRKQVRAIITRAKVASEHRNVFAHSRLSKSRLRRRTTIRIEIHRHVEAWRVEAIKVPQESLETVARTIASISYDLIAFNHAHLPISPGSLPYKFGR